MSTLQEDIKTLREKSTKFRKDAQEIARLSKKIYDQIFPEKLGPSETSMM